MISSILLALIFGFIIYNVLLMKKTIILNYKFNLNQNDKIRINNKCYNSF